MGADPFSLRLWVVSGMEKNNRWQKILRIREFFKELNENVPTLLCKPGPANICDLFHRFYTTDPLIFPCQQRIK